MEKYVWSGYTDDAKFIQHERLKSRKSLIFSHAKIKHCINQDVSMQLTLYSYWIENLIVSENN